MICIIILNNYKRCTVIYVNECLIFIVEIEYFVHQVG